METTTNIRRALRDSVEFSCVLRDMLLYTVFGVVFALVIRLRFLRDFESHFQTTIALWCGLFLTPVWAFGILKTLGIFRRADRYRLYRCTLTEPKRRRFLGGMYFRVELSEEGKAPVFVNTHPIFRAHGMSGPLLTEYGNRTVTIGYNEATGMVVVIG